MIFYHRTEADVAGDIIRSGFRDGTGNYLTTGTHTGVWLSNVPLDANEGAFGDTLLRVELPGDEGDFAAYEWVEDGKGYREWLIPAERINGRASVTIEDEE